MASSEDFADISRKAPEQVAQFTQKKSLLHVLQTGFHSNPALVPLVILVLTVIIFGLVTQGKFFSAFTLTLILQQVVITGIIAAGQNLVIISKGIDLSVGAITVLVSVVVGACVFRYGIPAPLALMIGLLLGAVCGAINGFLVAWVRLPAFIVTLGTWQIFLAANFIYSRNETISSRDINETAPLLQFFGTTFKPEWMGGAAFTYGVIAMLVLIAFLWYVLNHTAWGRHVYAVGDDAQAAELAGIRVRRTLISVYTVTGLICAFAGWVLIGRLGSVTPTAASLANIESITAVVIGGSSLFGGRGSILGTIFGALTVACFSLGLRLVGSNPQWTYLMIGVLTISAVALDQAIRKVQG